MSHFSHKHAPLCPPAPPTSALPCCATAERSFGPSSSHLPYEEEMQQSHKQDMSKQRAQELGEWISSDHFCCTHCSMQCRPQCLPSLLKGHRESRSTQQHNLHSSIKSSTGRMEKATHHSVKDEGHILWEKKGGKKSTHGSFNEQQEQETGRAWKWY